MERRHGENVGGNYRAGGESREGEKFSKESFRISKVGLAVGCGRENFGLGRSLSETKKPGGTLHSLKDGRYLSCSNYLDRRRLYHSQLTSKIVGGRKEEKNVGATEN